MIVEFLPPRESEADVKMSTKEGVVSITPFFSDPMSVRCVGYLTIKGDGGKERKYNLVVSGRTGTIRVMEARKVATEFDKKTSEEEVVADNE